MSAADDDELIAQLRRSLGSPSADTPSGDGPPAVSRDEPVPAGRPERTVSPAAMAIADQIMGLDAKIASTGLPWLRGGTGATHTVEQELVIGRLESDGRLIVADGRVSRSHARVTAADDRLVVEDLGSSNGTFLARGDELTRVGAEPVPLQAGDRIETVDRLLLAEVIEMEAS